MPKLAKQYYLNAKGKKKVNCYKVNIPKVVVEESGITDEDEIKIYTKDNKIIVEKENK